MAKFSLLALLSVSLVSATYIPRAAPGTQFITGPCSVDADCASGCCGFNSGKCAGAIIALTRDGGCGHGEQTNSRAAAVLRGNCPGTTVRREIIEAIEARAPLSPDPAGQKNVGNGKGGQFITGQCLSNADCGSGCCATLGNIGICSGPGAADQQGKTGCGFGGGAGGAAPPPPPPTNNGGAAPPPPPPAGGAGGGLKPDPAGEKNVGNGEGGQFITGQCLSNADCASACCATLGNIGICSGPGAANQQGKTGCGFSGGAAGGAAPPPVNNGGAAPPPPPPAAPAGGAATSGNADVGAACGKDSDCKTACCGFTSGKCALAKTAPGSDGGCGKGEAAPNTRAAAVINGNAPIC